MKRYEDMDRLLDGVRERLQGVKARAEESRSESPFSYAVSVKAESYDSVVGSLGILLRETGQVRQMVCGDEGRGLADDQREHLLTLIGQVMEELWACEAELQGVR